MRTPGDLRSGHIAQASALLAAFTMAENEFECYCGDKFGERELLIVHNVDLHGMERDVSQRKVDEKYPVS